MPDGRPGEHERPDRGHELGAVDQRQALLGGEHERLQAGAAQSLGAGHHLAVQLDHALADQRQGQVCERCQVAAGAQRAARRHHRVHARGEQRQQQLDGLAADAGRAGRERVRAQQHRGPHDLGREGVTDAAGVAAQQVELQPRDLVVLDGDVHEAAEPGVDPIGRRARLDRLVDHRPRAGDPVDRDLPQRDRGAAERDVLGLLDGEIGPRQLDRARHAAGSLCAAPIRGRTRR